MSGRVGDSDSRRDRSTDPVALLESGELLHPLSPHHPSYLDLVRYLYRVSGAPQLPPPRESEHRIAGFVGAPRHIVFVLVDGMGLNTAVHLPRGGFLERSYACEMRALFPSTTAVVLTSTATGLWPAENGITGWWTCLPQYERVILPLPFVDRETGEPLANTGIEYADLVPHPPLLDSLNREVRTFVPVDISAGSFTTWIRGRRPLHAFGSLDELARGVVDFIASRAGRPTFSHLYLSEVDALSHRYGYHATEVGAAIRRIDRFLRRLDGALPREARLVVTADHGQVVVDHQRHTVIDRESELMRYLEYPPSGEATVPLFHVKSGCEKAFADAFEASDAGSSFVLLDSTLAGELELFGPAPFSDAMRRRIGTYVGIATDSAMLDYVASGEKPLTVLGAHGGLRAGEMRIGLFVGA